MDSPSLISILTNGEHVSYVQLGMKNFKFNRSIFIIIALHVDPFYWAWLPLAREPFSENIREAVLDKLKDLQFVQTMTDEIRAVFSVSQ